MSNKAAYLESEKGSFVVRDAEVWQPGEGEVLVKVSTVQRLSNLANRVEVRRKEEHC